MSAAPESPRVDRYGFLSTDSRYVPPPTGTPAQLRRRLWLENDRAQRWLRTMGDPESDTFSRWCQRNPRRLKKRLRKGIPDAVRGRAWPALVGADRLLRENPGVYARLSGEAADGGSPQADVISRDIGRTYPTHEQFKAGAEGGRAALERVLLAYSMFDTHVGYCQGMGFLAGAFLTYMREEEAFWMLVAVMRSPPMEMGRMFEPDMGLVNEHMHVLDGLLRRFLPRLARHLEESGINAALVAQQWYITLFAYSFSFDLVTRVWDVFLVEGWKAVHRVVLALFKMHEQHMLQHGIEGLLHYFRDLEERIDVDQVFAVAFKLRLYRRQIGELSAEFQRQGVAA